MQKKLEKLKKRLGIILCGLLLLLYASPQAQSLREIEKQYTILQGEKVELQVDTTFSIRNENLAVTTLTNLEKPIKQNDQDTFSILGTQTGESVLTLSFLGKIPIKTVTVHVLPKRTLLPGGSVIGISMYTQGLYIVDVTGVADKEGKNRAPAKEAGIQSGDVLLQINGKSITNTEEMLSLMKNNQGEEVHLCVQRGEIRHNFPLTPAPYEKGGYKLGLWVRDSTAGVGTVTYVDPGNATYGALGHAITDADNGDILPIQSGDLYHSNVVGIHKGEKGTPGELQGLFRIKEGVVGSVEANTEQGIFGHLYQKYENSLYPYGCPVTTMEQIKIGEATILSTLDEKGVKAYRCRIVKLSNPSFPSSRNLILEITDPALLEKAGGIVQGMSGSPILQDGKLIGAVTHVFVNDPTKGYGISIEKMLRAAPTDDAV